jgi:hypothetical protein
MLMESSDFSLDRSLMKTVVSSANKVNLQAKLVHNGKSLMKIKKRSGPNMEP